MLFMKNAYIKKVNICSPQWRNFYRFSHAYKHVYACVKSNLKKNGPEGPFVLDASRPFGEAIHLIDFHDDD